MKDETLLTKDQEDKERALKQHNIPETEVELPDFEKVAEAIQ